MEITSGGSSSFDLTPGAPSAQWQSGTTEPTLLRIRGMFVGLVRSAVAVTTGGVREVRVIGVLLAWRHAGAPFLDPFLSQELSSEQIIYAGLHSFDTRDFVVQASGSPVNEGYSNIAGPGIAHWPIDVKAKRRVRSEDDRLMLYARCREFYTTSSPPETSGVADVSGRLLWQLRFLYRTSR